MGKLGTLLLVLGLGSCGGVTSSQLPTTFYVPRAHGHARAEVVLGKKHLVQYGIGWGTAHPRLVFNGGDPGGQARQLTWRHWGAAVAYARGVAPIPYPAGNYYPKPGVIELRASRIGRCTPAGPRAYTYLEVREAVRPGGRLGRWSVWSGWKSICNAP